MKNSQLLSIYQPCLNFYMQNFSAKKVNPSIWKKKRTIDLCIATPAYLISSPIILLAGLAAKLETKGPAIFKQKRITHGGKEFTCYKIRTMVNEEKTKVGQFLRKYSIDELPQFLNVLKGDMSIIGPRAIPAEEIKEMITKTKNTNVLKRLCVKSGFGFGNNEKTWELNQKLHMEQNYVKKLNKGELKQDFQIFKNILMSLLNGKNS